MVRSRLGLKALGLCALVLGVMAIASSAAQAEAGAEWLYEGSELKTLKPGGVQLEPTVEGVIENSDASLLTKIIGIAVKFLCTSGELVGVKLQPGGHTNNTGRILFHGCKTFLKGSATATESCEPFKEEVGGKPVDKGLILTDEGKALLTLHNNGETVTTIEPTGAKFGTIHMSELCAIGEEVPVFGKFVAKDCQNEATVEKVTHLIEELPTLTSLYVISDTPEHLETHIDGSANISLGGSHLGKKWSGHAG